MENIFECFDIVLISTSGKFELRFMSQHSGTIFCLDMKYLA